MTTIRRAASKSLILLLAVCGIAHAEVDGFRFDRTVVFPLEDRGGDGKTVVRDGIRAHIISPDDASLEAMDRYADSFQQRFADAIPEHQRTLFVVRFYKSGNTTPRKVHEVLYNYQVRHGWLRLQPQ
jgi:hypothetical protein